MGYDEMMMCVGMWMVRVYKVWGKEVDCEQKNSRGWQPWTGHGAKTGHDMHLRIQIGHHLIPERPGHLPGCNVAHERAESESKSKKSVLGEED